MGRVRPTDRNQQNDEAVFDSESEYTDAVGDSDNENPGLSKGVRESFLRLFLGAQLGRKVTCLRKSMNEPSAFELNTRCQRVLIVQRRGQLQQNTVRMHLLAASLIK